MTWIESKMAKKMLLSIFYITSAGKFWIKRVRKNGLREEKRIVHSNYMVLRKGETKVNEFCHILWEFFLFSVPSQYNNIQLKVKKNSDFE